MQDMLVIDLGAVLGPILIGLICIFAAIGFLHVLGNLSQQKGVEETCNT